MAEARKCDRCHAFYELPEKQQDRDAHYEFKGAYVKLLFCDNNRDYPNTVRWYDLCPNCVELLDKWLENPDNYDPQDLVKDITEEYGRVIKSGDRRAIAHFKNKHGYTMTKEEMKLVSEDCLTYIGDDDERVNNLYKEAEEISNNAGDTKEEEK